MLRGGKSTSGRPIFSNVNSAVFPPCTKLPVILLPLERCPVNFAGSLSWVASALLIVNVAFDSSKVMFVSAAPFMFKPGIMIEPTQTPPAPWSNS